MRVRSLLVAGSLLIFGAFGCGDESIEPTPVGPTDPAQLEPPPSGQGFQVETADIEVAPGTEVQDCYFFRVSELAASGGLAADQSIYLHRVQIAQEPGSHHMNIFRVKTIKGLDPAKGAVQHGKTLQDECFKSPNWSDWPLVANSQQDGQLDWAYPDGVANQFAPDEWLMLQTHYVNATTQKTPADVGHVSVNFWTVPKDQVTAEVGTLFATTQSIRICQSSPKPTVFSQSCQFNNKEPVHVIGANGHFHSRGRQFDIFSWDGKTATTPPDTDRFYRSQAWDDPPMAHSPELDVELPASTGVFYSCSFEWTQPDASVGCAGVDEWDTTKYMTKPEDLDCCYTFGPIVEKNEHCNAFVYYYPKQESDVTCL